MRKDIRQNKKYPTLSSALIRGQKSAGKNLLQLVTDKESRPDNITIKRLKNNSKSKALVGDAFEDWFGKKRDNSQYPDINNKNYSLELKTTSFRREKTVSRQYKNIYKIKERLVFDMINYRQLSDNHLSATNFFKKDQNILLAFYQYHKSYKSKNLKIKTVVLFNLFGNKTCKPVKRYVHKALANPYVNIIHIEPDKYSTALIIGDWLTLKREVQNDKPIKESDTALLDPCKKSNKSRRDSKWPSQYKRAYALKPSYMDFLANYYDIFGTSSLDHKQIRSIFNKKTKKYLHNDDKHSIYPITLKSFIRRIVSRFVGKSNKHLAKKFGIKLSSKQVNYQIISSIFGIHASNLHNSGITYASELLKAGIIPKTIQFGNNQKDAQDMSFPSFSFSEFNNEDWNNSIIHHILYGHTFLFCVFKDSIHTSSNATPKDSVFQGAFLYNFNDLCNIDKNKIKHVWNDTKAKSLKYGIKLTPLYSPKTGKLYKIVTDLTHSSDKMIIHVRSHASYASYSKNDFNSSYVPAGLKWNPRPSNDTKKYSNNYMTKQCFFVNKKFITDKCIEHGLI